VYTGLYEKVALSLFSNPSLAVATQCAMAIEGTTGPVFLLDRTDTPNIEPCFGYDRNIFMLRGFRVLENGKHGTSFAKKRNIDKIVWPFVCKTN